MLARTVLPFLMLRCLAPGATTSPTPSQQLSQAEIDQIIAKFAAKEAAFARARENYTYRQTVKIQELDESGTPGGKYQEVSDIVFSPEGKRTEKVVYAPVNGLEHIIMTPEDVEDMRDVMPFVLTTSEIPNYYIRYLGHQQVDEVPCHVFAVKPKRIDVPGKRYFEGEIWVDDKDLQIVKTYGRGVGDIKKSKNQQFPKFETYREQIDGKYWFPTYTYANDTLNFDTGPQRIKQIIKYEDYKQFKSDVNIKFGDEVSAPAGQSAAPQKLAPPLAPEENTAPPLTPQKK